MIIQTTSGAALEDEFNYQELPTEDAEFLRQKAARINARRHITHTLIEEMGKDLIEAKERLPGVFLRWARTEFQFSDDTIENYMNVAARLPALPAGTPAPIQARALYLLSRDSTPEAVRQEAVSIAEQGTPVDYKTAFILAAVDLPTVKARYLKEELPKETAYELVRALSRKSLNPTVKQVCIEQGVTSPELVDYLDKAYRDYVATKGTTHERLTWKDIERDNWVLNGFGWSLPIAQVRPVDIERFKADRAAIHVDKAMESYEWFRGTATLECINGKNVFVWNGNNLPSIPEGEKVMIDVRVKQQ